MFGINSSEFIILLIVAALVLGPKNIAQAIRGLRSILERFVVGAPSFGRTPASTWAP